MQPQCKEVNIYIASNHNNYNEMKLIHIAFSIVRNIDMTNEMEVPCPIQLNNLIY